nr:mucin-7-like [Aegilops tauschii subsp. strangulata]
MAGPGPRCAPDASRVRAAAAPVAGLTAARCRASMATVAGPDPRCTPTPAGSVPPQLPAPPPPSTGPGSPTQGGVPIQQVRFPPSPSPIPAWLAGSSPPPIYTSAGDPPAPTLQFGDPSGSAGHSKAAAMLTGRPNPRCFAPPSQSATALRLRHRRSLPNWTSPLMTARRTPSTGSTNASSSFAGSTPSLRSVPGSPLTTSAARHRPGTTP